MVVGLRAYSYLEVDCFVGKGGDGVVEAEAVFAHFCRGEDEVALSLLLAVHDYAVFAWFFAWAVYYVVDCDFVSMLSRSSFEVLAAIREVGIPSKDPPACTAK